VASARASYAKHIELDIELEDWESVWQWSAKFDSFGADAQMQTAL
jgi:hypothetical protein